jgi:hypothetical protein
MLEESAKQAPLTAVRHRLLKLASQYEDKESILVDRLLQFTERSRARKHAVNLQMEEMIFHCSTQDVSRNEAPAITSFGRYG